jgi:lipopolysaccharide biosynthesis glycosyltransferase
MAQNKKHISIVQAFDDGYACSALITALSVMDHLDKSYAATFYFIAKDISPDNTAFMAAQLQPFPAKIVWIDPSPCEKMIAEMMGQKKNYAVPSYTTAYRLFLEMLLPKACDKVLYLDSDTLVVDDLSSLWNTILDKPLAAVADEYAFKHCLVNETPFKAEDALALKEDTTFFNSGMMLIDLKWWRAEKIQEQCLYYSDRYKAYLHFMDQDMLNIVFLNNWQAVHPKYNLFQHSCESYIDYFYFNPLSMLREAEQQPVIIHYTCNNPWSRNIGLIGLKSFLRYRKYMKRIGWKAAPWSLVSWAYYYTRNHITAELFVVLRRWQWHRKIYWKLLYKLPLKMLVFPPATIGAVIRSVRWLKERS